MTNDQTFEERFAADLYGIYDSVVIGDGVVGCAIAVELALNG